MLLPGDLKLTGTLTEFSGDESIVKSKSGDFFLSGDC